VLAPVVGWPVVARSASFACAGVIFAMSLSAKPAARRSAFMAWVIMKGMLAVLFGSDGAAAGAAG
jgi:hypothetical protein